MNKKNFALVFAFLLLFIFTDNNYFYYISNNDYNYCECDNLEADDITYIIQKKIKDEFNNLLYEVRQNRNNNIDFSKNFNNITNQ